LNGVRQHPSLKLPTLSDDVGLHLVKSYGKQIRERSVRCRVSFINEKAPHICDTSQYNDRIKVANGWVTCYCQRSLL